MKLRACLAAILTISAASASAQVSRTGTVISGVSTILTSNQSQMALQGDTSRAWVYCQNPSTETEPLYVEPGGVASPTTSISLQPGGVWAFQAGPVPTNPIFVTANTVGHRYVCKAGY